jgi:HK97 family phage portal protein
MSVLARLGGPRAGAVEKRTLTESAFVPPPAVGVIDDFVGVHRAMSVMTVYACVRLLADTIASLPWKVYRRDAEGIPVEVRPQPILIRSPWPGFDLFQYKWTMVASLALRGNFYGMITSRDPRSDYPTAIMPLHPDVVFLERRPDILRWFDPIYRVMGEVIPANDMLHVRRFTMPGEPWGLSPVRQAAVAIGESLAAEEYGYRFFKESANPSGLLCSDQDLDDGAVLQAQQQWIKSHQGRRLPAVLANGFKFQPLSIKPEESQFLQTRQFQRSEICIMYGVPPILIGDTKETTAWGTGVEQINLAAVAYTFRAWTTCVESVFSNMLPGGQFVKFDFSALLRGDIKTRFDAYKTALMSFWITPNEVRAQEEMEPLKSGGDEPLQPANYVPLGFEPMAGGVLTKPLTVSAPVGKPGATPPQPLPGMPITGGEFGPGNNQPVAPVGAPAPRNGNGRG